VAAIVVLSQGCEVVATGGLTDRRLAVASYKGT